MNSAADAAGTNAVRSVHIQVVETQSRADAGPGRRIGLPKAEERSYWMPQLRLFVFLQLLDFLTTMVGLRLGASEASPFIRLLMQFGPATGVALSKAIALGLAGICLWVRKYRLLRWANYWYGTLVVWNLIVILMAATR